MAGPGHAGHAGSRPPAVRADWKGSVLAESDDTVIVEGNAGAAWYYPAPKEAAAQIRYRVAFGRGVRVSVTQI